MFGRSGSSAKGGVVFGPLLLALMAVLLLGALAACGSDEATPTPAAAVDAPTPTPLANISDIAATGATSGETGPRPTGERPVYGGIMNYMGSSTARHMDPYHILASGPRGGANYLWHNGLIQIKFPYDPSKGVELEPGLATEWSVSADGTEWTLKLRQNVTFHDGELFTADDVVATMKRILDPEINIQRRQVAMKSVFVDVRKIDDYTVVYDVGELPNSTAFTFLSSHHMAMAPGHLITGDDPTSTDVEERWTWMGPDPDKQSGTLGVGTGPFKMTRWEADVELIGDRNPNYWRFDEDGNQLPYLDQYILTAVPNATRRLANFVAGAADYTLGSAAGMHPDKATLLCGQSRDTECYTMQFPHGSFPVIANPGSTPVFNDPKFMTATFYAADMDKILTQAYGGRQGYMWNDRGRFPETALSLKEQYAALPWSDPGRRSEFVQKAKDLVIDAGYANGIDLPLPAFANTCSDSFLNHATLELEAYFQVGIRMELECREGIVRNDELKAGRWSMTVLGTNISTVGPGENWRAWALLDSGAVASAPWRWEGQVPLDAMYRKTVTTVDDALRNESYKEMERYMANPTLSMFQSGFTTVYMSVHGCVHNFRPGGTWESYAFTHERTWLSGDCRNG